jgi:hypothetical protein
MMNLTHIAAALQGEGIKTCYARQLRV